MAKRIFKYQLKTLGVQALVVPKGAQVLTVQIQRGIITLWALCPDVVNTEKWMFGVFGTGHEISESLSKDNWIASVQDRDYVWHVFSLESAISAPNPERSVATNAPSE